ncbi:MAG: SET domain-containing protein-lysine N-methyltransferase [Saprospiraceae bacterium]|nr:SET domain-containing protein-lysine N-methyltransferase [Saprospiraceae bacterium]MBP6448203.1 SET domain-containing protein-lysine N-methyltransferase [Saprospiraceae bacterium]
MHQIPGLYTAHDDQKGRGVYTSIPVSIGDLIEVCPVIVIPKVELPIIHKTILHDYYFLWGEDMDDAAIALGFGSLYNHAIHPNANFILDMENNTIDIVAILDINPGEEVTINYHGEPGDESVLWF